MDRFNEKVKLYQDKSDVYFEEITNKTIEVSFDAGVNRLSIELNELYITTFFLFTRERTRILVEEGCAKAGRYCSIIASEKRRVMRDFVISVAELFLLYFDIRVNAETVSAVIKGLFNIPVKPDAVLKFFPQAGVQENEKKDWSALPQEDRALLFHLFRDVFDAQEHHRRIKH